MSNERPTDWTVDGMPPTKVCDNIAIATMGGPNIQTPPGQPFLAVSHTEAFADYVVDSCRKHV